MKKNMAIIMSLVILFNMLVPASLCAAKDYEYHWASDELIKWSEYGVINGYTDGDLRPDNYITRVELLKIIDNLFKFTDGPSEGVYSDVLSDAWYADVVNRASANGIVNGFPDGTFRPNENVTREHAVLILFKAFKMSDLSDKSVVSSNTFSDSQKVSNGAKEAIDYFIYMGYINGYEDYCFKPQAYITRAEIIKIIDSIVDLYVDDDETSIEAKLVENVLITGADVSLKDVSVNNALYISEAVGDSDVVLDSVKIDGITYIEGGGENSIHIIDSDMGMIVADKRSGETLRIVVEGSSSVESLITNNSVIIEDTTTNGKAIRSITVSDQVPANTTIKMIGEFEELNYEAESIDILLDGTIDTLVNNGSQLNVNDEEVESGTNTSVEGTIVSEDSANNSNDNIDNDSNNDTSNDLEEWTIYWNDEFNGNELDLSKWRYETGNWIVDDNGNAISPGWGNNEKQYYTDSTNNIFLSDGTLVLRALEEEVSDEFGTYQFTSGKLVTNDLFSKKYGKFEARMKLPAGQGLWPAFWMMPDDDVYGGWASSGEIDIMEAAGSDPYRTGGTIHYGEAWPNNTYNGSDYDFPEGESITDFHVYSLEWEPGEIRWYVDGELYQTQNNWYSKGVGQLDNYSYPAPFDQEFYMILNLAVGGWYDGDPEDLSVIPAEVVVDYVRVYELTGRDYREPTIPEHEPAELSADAKFELADGNLVYNNNYDGTNLGDLDYNLLYENIYTEGISGIENSEFWYFLNGTSLGASFGGNGTISIDDTLGDSNYAKIDISDIGIQPYSVQFIQDVSLATDNYYTLSFDAKSTGNRSIAINIAGDGNDGDAHGWASYAKETFELTDELSNYEFTFQMLSDTDLDARLEFNLGLNAKTVWLGNIRLESIEPPVIDENATKEPLSNGNLIYNGTFDQGNMDRLTYWNLEVDEADASIQVDEATRELEVKINDGGTMSSSVQVSQKGLQLEALKEYELNFDASALNDRNIEVSIVNEDGTVTYTDSHSITLTPQMNNYTYTFIMPDVTDTMGQLQFNIGNDDSNVYLDNISIFMEDGYVDGTPDISYLFREGFSDTDGITGILEPLGNTTTLISSITKDGDKAIAFNHNAGSWGGFYVNLSSSIDVSHYGNLVISVQRPEEITFLEIKPESGGTGPLTPVNLFAYIPVMDGDWEVYTIPLEDFKGVDLSQLEVFGLWNPMDASNSFIDCEIIFDDLYFDGTADEPSSDEVTSGFELMTFDSEEEAWSSWWGDEWSGIGSGTVSVTGGVLVADITGVGSASYAPQIYNEGFALEKGKTYTVSFDVKADEPRKMNVNIGKALTSDPWFTSYADTQVINVTTTSEVVSYTFTVDEETDDNLKMVFELGTINGEDIATTLYFDNISILEYDTDDGSGDDEQTNIALNKSVVVSSYEGGFKAEYATDGNVETRWASEWNDSEWIYVDLGESMTVKGVLLSWEAAYGKSYSIQVSDDATNWSDVFTTTNGDGGTDDITFEDTYVRYVRMLGVERATAFGYSLFEFEVY